MAALTLSALAAIGSILGTGLGVAGGIAANNEALDTLKNEHAADDRPHRRLLDRDVMESPENAGLMRRLQEMERNNYLRARATNVVAGGTDAHLAAMQQQGAKVVSDTGNAIAERSQAFKDKVMESKRASDKAYAQQMFGLQQQRAKSIATAAGQATKAMAGIAAAGAPAENPYDMFDLGKLTDAELKELKDRLGDIS